MTLVILMGSTSILHRYYHLYSMGEYENSIPYELDTLVGDNWKSYSKKNYMIYVTNLKSGYISCASKYKTFSPNVKIVSSIDDNFQSQVLAGYDYLIILDESDEIDAFMKEYVDEIDYYGIYPVQETFIN